MKLRQLSLHTLQDTSCKVIFFSETEFCARTTPFKTLEDCSIALLIMVAALLFSLVVNNANSCRFAISANDRLLVIGLSLRRLIFEDGMTVAPTFPFATASRHSSCVSYCLISASGKRKDTINSEYSEVSVAAIVERLLLYSFPL